MGVPCCFYIPYMSVLMKTVLKKVHATVIVFLFRYLFQSIFPQLSYLSFLHSSSC